MTNSKLFDPSLNFDDEEVQLFNYGITDINVSLIDISKKRMTRIPKILSKCKNINHLHLDNNQIMKIENVPEGTLRLNLGHNQISKIENIPEGIIELYLSNNRIPKIENIPEGTLKLISLYGNPLKQITKQALEIIKKNKTKVYGVDIDKLEVVDD